MLSSGFADGSYADASFGTPGSSTTPPENSILVPPNDFTVIIEEGTSGIVIAEAPPAAVGIIRPVRFDWEKWLQGDSIIDTTWIIPSEDSMTIISSEQDGAVTSLWLTPLEKGRHRIFNEVQTMDGRKERFGFLLLVV